MLGIIGALPEEVNSIISELTDHQVFSFGKRDYHVGFLENKPVVVVYSGIGKIAAASTATTLLNKFDIDSVIFTGVAGGANEWIDVNDIVIGTHLYQHDMDAGDIFKSPCLYADKNITEGLKKVIEGGYLGGMGTGDKFFSSKEELMVVRERFPDIMCVEMEGYAVAQVCGDYSIPFGIFRTISDNADENSVVDFPRFIEKCCLRTVEIIKNYIGDNYGTI